mmetsp:Transcript_21223/g.70079  ORF Transcript_21223/g.70079 Transcript_21223/m.70079 type:complete len:319 (+) Transcript_21223:415-1371(+)
MPMEPGRAPPPQHLDEEDLHGRGDAERRAGALRELDDERPRSGDEAAAKAGRDPLREGVAAHDSPVGVHRQEGGGQSSPLRAGERRAGVLGGEGILSAKGEHAVGVVLDDDHAVRRASRVHRPQRGEARAGGGRVVEGWDGEERLGRPDAQPAPRPPVQQRAQRGGVDSFRSDGQRLEAEAAAAHPSGELRGREAKVELAHEERVAWIEQRLPRALEAVCVAGAHAALPPLVRRRVLLCDVSSHPLEERQVADGAHARSHVVHVLLRLGDELWLVDADDAAVGELELVCPDGEGGGVRRAACHRHHPVELEQRQELSQ